MSSTKSTKIDAKTVRCTKCDAPVGVRCVTSSGANAKQPHPQRVIDARSASIAAEYDATELAYAERTAPTCPCGKRTGERDLRDENGASTVGHGPECCTCERGSRVHETACPANAGALGFEPVAAVAFVLCGSCGALGHEQHGDEPCTGAAGLGACTCMTQLAADRAAAERYLGERGFDAADVMRETADALLACTGSRSVTVTDGTDTITATRIDAELHDAVRAESVTARERVRRTVVELAPELVAAVLAPQLIAVADAPVELTCVRCSRTLPSSTFPTVKSGGATYRKTECRACRTVRAAAGVRTDGQPVGTRKPVTSRSERVSAENAATLALVAGLDLAAIAVAL